MGETRSRCSIIIHSKSKGGVSLYPRSYVQLVQLCQLLLCNLAVTSQITKCKQSIVDILTDRMSHANAHIMMWVSRSPTLRSKQRAWDTLAMLKIWIAGSHEFEPRGIVEK